MYVSELEIAPYIIITSLFSPQHIGGGRSWVRGVVLESDRGRLSWSHSKDEG